jgi:N-methylhydantoinase A
MVGDFPLMMPVTGIEAIGAGGGSIAEMNGGVLKVGPRSAGSRPGPACYGQGGTLPTISDAYLLCGLLDPGMFLGGAMPLHRDRAEAAMAPLAQALGRDVVSAAQACIAVATSNMTASVLPYLARVGVDPPDLTLLVYGGAGAIHGPLLAEEIGIQRLIVPRTPSVFCALGGVVSDLVHDVVRSVRGSLMTIERLRSQYEELAAEARSWLDKQVPKDVLTGSDLTLYAEMRFRGQFFTVDVPLSRSVLDAPDLAMTEAAFRTEHERIYRHDSDAPVDFVGLRVRVAGRLSKPGGVALPSGIGKSSDAIVARRAIRLHGRAYPDTPVIDRTKLGPGHRFRGPAIVEQADATILVPPGFEASVGVFGDLVLTR